MILYCVMIEVEIPGDKGSEIDRVVEWYTDADTRDHVAYLWGALYRENKRETNHRIRAFNVPAHHIDEKLEEIAERYGEVLYPLSKNED